MLVLTRKKGETVMIGDDIEVMVLGGDGDSVKIGIRAPRHVSIYRKEVYLAIQEANREASKLIPAAPNRLDELIRRGRRS